MGGWTGGRTDGRTHGHSNVWAAGWHIVQSYATSTEGMLLYGKFVMENHGNLVHADLVLQEKTPPDLISEIFDVCIWPNYKNWIILICTSSLN